MLASNLRELILCNRFYDYNEYRLKAFARRIGRETEKGKRLIDVGAGQTQYKKYFSNLEYVAQDSCVGDEQWDFSRIDIKSEIYDIPVEAASFDYVFCTQVMEHLRYPDKAFAEFNRLLKPGGRLYVTCPMTWKEHQQPHDFFRYTQFALKGLAHDHGFTMLEINKVGGKFITIAKLLTDLYFVLKLPKPLLYLAVLILYPINFSIGLIAYLLDFLDRSKELTLQYECILEKKTT